jgi:hypothetical protein
MKQQLNISFNWKKLTAIILLLNFAFSPILFAFPQEECNGVCELSSASHDCSMDETEYKNMPCCDMMEMNSTNNIVTSTNCGMELSDINCAYIFHEKSNALYLIPKINDSNIEFVQITTINFQKESFIVELFELNLEFSLRDKPPIYLFKESFLI